ncbi:MAG: hypothetical protein HZA16_10725 [Nitrospirae bacterium]|nr:hypothetical protein [Nitrospirota bacterium]
MKRGLLRSISLSLMIIFTAIPSQNYASTAFRVDLDANEPGLQKELWVMPGDSFTANIELVLTDSSDSISSFGFSLWWDTDELDIAGPEGVVTAFVADGWRDLSYLNIQTPFINNFAQVSFNSSEGPLTAVIASIDWTAGNPQTDRPMDVTPGIYGRFDEFYDGNAGTITPHFESGKINLLPEPASPALFLSGIGALTAGLCRRRVGFFFKLVNEGKKKGADLRGHA